MLIVCGLCSIVILGCWFTLLRLGFLNVYLGCGFLIIVFGAVLCLVRLLIVFDLIMDLLFCGIGCYWFCLVTCLWCLSLRL